MKSFSSLLFLSSLVFISCKKELQPQDSSASSNIIPFTEAANPQSNQTVTQNQTLQNQNTAAQNTAVTAPNSVAKGMNPAHGQPGHRCEIAVGAPLNSTAATPKTAPVVVPESTNSTPTALAAPNPTTPTTPTPEGINPPHGQENHRCDISVGAPLPKE